MVKFSTTIHKKYIYSIIYWIKCTLFSAFLSSRSALANVVLPAAGMPHNTTRQTRAMARLQKIVEGSGFEPGDVLRETAHKSDGEPFSGSWEESDDASL